MEWFESLYDDFRQRTGFGNLPPDRTRADVDFMVEELSLRPGNKVLDLFSGTGRHSIELSRRGIEVVGVELSAQYVDLAEERARAADVTPQFVTGALFLGLTFGIFAVLGIQLPQDGLRRVAAWGIGAIPILALASVYDPTTAPVAQSWATGLARILRILSRLLLPLALGVLAVYVFWFIPAYFCSGSPFRSGRF